MKILFRAPSVLLQRIRADLHRPHPFAAERVGFLSCRTAAAENDLLIIAADYYPVADGDYIDDLSVGAMMGPAAIRKALQVSLTHGSGMFHIHMHEHRGIPRFSATDLRENCKFVPDFFNVSPRVPHGAVVLSYDAMAGLCWLERQSRPLAIELMSSVGAQIIDSRGTIV
jgi:hypothetical protein